MLGLKNHILSRALSFSSNLQVRRRIKLEGPDLEEFLNKKKEKAAEDKKKSAQDG